MGLLDGILGGFIGGEMASMVNRLIAEQGGISAIVSKFQQAGLGPTVQSWISAGPNTPVSPTQVHQALGPDLLQQLAAKTGLSQQDLTEKLSQVLPGVVDHLTPDVVVPKGEAPPPSPQPRHAPGGGAIRTRHRPDSHRQNVDVVPEEVLGVVLRLDLSQPRQVRSVRDRGGIARIVFQVIDVTRRRKIRRE